MAATDNAAPAFPGYRMLGPLVSYRADETFEGKDEADIRKQLWDWRSENPNITVTHEGPVERLTLELSEVSPGKKLEAPNLVSMRIVYDER